MTQTRRLRLTDRIVRALKPAASTASYRVADAEQVGLVLIVGRRTKAFTAQADLRLNGRRIRTVKRVLGRAPDMTARTARAAAREFLGQIARGEDPNAQRRHPAGLTLAETWELYEEEHLRRLGRSARTIANYRFHVERHLKEWKDTPLAELGRDPRRVADMHTEITTTAGPSQANAVMRSFRTLYRFARRQTPDQLPTQCPAQAITFHPERRRNTAMGMSDLAAWWRQLQALMNPIRVEFHLTCLLSGSRPGALKAARWCDVDVRRRVLHVPCPKGGEDRAFDIPLSRAMLRSLWRARKAGRKRYAEQVQEWIFPAAAASGHLAEHKENRWRLSHWGGDLRQSYRTIAQAIGVAELDVHLLMNHSLPGTSAGYVTRAKLLSTSLREAQERLSTSIVVRMTSEVAISTKSWIADIESERRYTS
jgi:integrase